MQAINKSLSFYLTLLFSGSLLLPGCSEQAEASFELQSPTALPAGTLITIDLPEDIACCEKVQLKESDGGQKIALQAGAPGEAQFLLEATLPANTSRQYEIIKNSDTESIGPVIQETETALEISSNDHPILTYNTATLSPPEDLPDYYKRSGFIHPFFSPGGKVLTDGFPVGHTHQHGIFFAWVNTTYRGDFTDFWNQQNETGTVAFRELQAQGSGPVYAHFQAKHEALSLEHGPVLDETWEVKTYAIPGYNIIDLTIYQKVTDSDTLFINKYHYGGMGVRMAAELNEVDSTRYTGPMQVITSEGIANRDSANHSRPNWTAAYGQVNGSTGGIALFDHPANFRFPQPVRVHPSMPYFVLAPMVEDAFELVPGEEYVFRYRILSFDGEPNTEQLDAMWQAYAKGATINWRE